MTTFQSTVEDTVESLLYYSKKQLGTSSILNKLFVGIAKGQPLPFICSNFIKDNYNRKERVRGAEKKEKRNNNNLF